MAITLKLVAGALSSFKSTAPSRVLLGSYLVQHRKMSNEQPALIPFSKDFIFRQVRERLRPNVLSKQKLTEVKCGQQPSRPMCDNSQNLWLETF